MILTPILLKMIFSLFILFFSTANWHNFNMYQAEYSNETQSWHRFWEENNTGIGAEQKAKGLLQRGVYVEWAGSIIYQIALLIGLWQWTNFAMECPVMPISLLNKKEGSSVQLRFFYKLWLRIMHQLLEQLRILNSISQLSRVQQKQKQHFDISCYVTLQ